jgi:antirestriction protein ArdC
MRNQDVNNGGRKELYAKVVSGIIAMLAQGTVPWQKEWVTPRNAFSRHAYRGINYMILTLCECESPYWATFRQIAKVCYPENAEWYAQQVKSGKQKKTYVQDESTHKKRLWAIGDPLPKYVGYPYGVKKGLHGMTVVFWAWVIKRSADETDEDAVAEGKAKMIPILRLYTVFNVLGQCTLPDRVKEKIKEAHTEDVIGDPEKIITTKDLPAIKHDGGARAYYDPKKDIIHMPKREIFFSDSGYFATKYHELVHSTGAASRLSRDLTGPRGYDVYSKEELTAELGAAFLCSVAGIANKQTEASSASYIASWLSVLKDDPSVLISAAGQAQKAADYLQGIQYTTDTLAEGDNGNG